MTATQARSNGQYRERRIVPAPFFTGADLLGVPVPPRDWHVTDVVPGYNVTLLGGDGGTGKSLLALQLAVATVTCRPWLGREVRQGGALYLSAEDDRAELHRRLAAILVAERGNFAELDRLTLLSLAGENALLAGPRLRSSALQPTPLFKTLDQRLGDERPALLVLDTLADLFGGSEIDRGQARQFIGLCRGLALRHACAVLLLAHPSLSGMASGSGGSGSTAWSNSVRSRLYLERRVEDGYEADPDRRCLVVKKINYGRTGGEIGMTWRDGLFVVDETETSLGRLAGGAKAERVFLAKLREFTANGRYVSAQPGPTYAPAVFAKSPGAEGVSKRALVGTMEALFAAKRICGARHGSGAKTRSHLAEVAP